LAFERVVALPFIAQACKFLAQLDQTLLDPRAEIPRANLNINFTQPSLAREREREPIPFLSLYPLLSIGVWLANEFIKAKL